MHLQGTQPAPPPVDEKERESMLPPDPGLGMGPADSQLKVLFTSQLKDLLWAEQKIAATLPKMSAAATSASLRELFDAHLLETQMHITRLERAFSLMGAPAEATQCEAMAGIVEEGERIIEETQAGTSTRDAGLVLAAQKVEHYEMAAYGGLACIAHLLGLLDVKGLLEATLDEEKSADKKLSLAASSGINRQAVMEAGLSGQAAVQ